MPPRRSRLQPLAPLSPGAAIAGGNEPIFILPRQPGESTYQYRYRRSLSLYGQTPYQRRIFLAQQRGVGLSAARGHGERGGLTESQRRNRQSVLNTGLTVSQIRNSELRAWLEQYGYTPELTGMSWTNLIRLAPRLRWMYDAVGDDGARVLPEMIYNAVILETEGELEPGWAFNRLWQKYDDMISYRQFTDKQPGNESWVGEYLQVQVFVPSIEPQWYYYH